MCDQPIDAGTLAQDSITRIYHCPKCKSTHTVKIPKDITKERSRFPFPYAFLHSSEGELQDLLTIAYLDAQLQIRGVDVIEIKDSEGIFSEKLTKDITEKLMDTIVNLQEENLRLQELLGTIDVTEFEELEPEDELELEEDEEWWSTLDDVLDVEEEIMITELDDDDNESEEEPKQEHKQTMITLRTKTPSGIKFKTPLEKTPNVGEKITIYLLSTIGPGEKKQKLTVDTSNLVYDIKETVGNLYGLIPANFHLSSGGVTFDEDVSLYEYNLQEGDEILIIPSSTAGNQ